MALLDITALDAFYGDFQALFGLDLTVGRGETLAIIGANGAGKSTLLKTITGLIPARREAVRFDGEPIGGLPAADIMRRGIAMVPEGRKLFPSLTVEENLLVGGWGRKGSGRWSLAALYELFPILGARRNSPGTALSGGQQQMVAIGRALISNPSLLLCDEISLGLAPIVIRDVYACLPSIRAEGTAIVLVEQDIVQALAVADRVVCLQEGRATLEGRPAELSREAIQHAYFGD
ncbi:ABC transporter ATP-binding protein [Labrys wisconsinensis]|uniref:Branched-chain amino acid transport system ATP-binding protein n=1 Tax=Labrys wisconsinensis TaxID=425677 RepID=A0ABU0JHY5_9HYPH|nr:ABC transporter ATP-binding protein [Labrys wisconsinensis]MDQ0473904.1 branched-chain amino acid transport system ATP-binding protein [Labrys wisconsinensis]